MSVLETLFNSPLGKQAARQVGLADPPKLRRGRVRPEGPVLVTSIGGGTLVAQTLALLGIDAAEPQRDLPDVRMKDDKGREVPPEYDRRPGAIVVDATKLRTITQLEEVRQILRPAMRGLERSGRIIMVATHVDDVDGLEAKTVQQSLDGINRTVGKELRGGATTNLIVVRHDVEAADLASTIAFLLDGRSAFVHGQTWLVSPSKVRHDHSERPFKGRVVVVTGAARGIGADIARTFARDGATVVAIDMPQAGESLAKVANEIKGSALHLDITAADAGERIARHVAQATGGEIWAIVHNAGITRDKMLANLDEKRWAQVLEVNLAAAMRINEYLLGYSGPGGFGDEARIVGIASTSGWAGNKGQANYAASKAGVMGYTRALSLAIKRRSITVNAVAPGFIETEMTGAIPFVQREIFRRSNSLAQGGRPVDVAELIAYECEPASSGIDGQVIRVCGQNLVGA